MTMLLNYDNFPAAAKALHNAPYTGLAGQSWAC
jgi:hypothetical protein